MPALVSSQFSPQFFRQSQNFRNEHFLCDCRLVVAVSPGRGNTNSLADENSNPPTNVSDLDSNPATLEFPAHRLVLAASSQFFWNLFQLKRHETMTTVNLNNCTPECLEVILRFLYSGELQLGFCHPQQVLNVAKVFQITTLEQMLSPLTGKATPKDSTPTNASQSNSPSHQGKSGKRKNGENAHMGESPASASAMASPGFFKRLCQKHSLLSCTYCIPTTSVKSGDRDSGSEASVPYEPVAKTESNTQNGIGNGMTTSGLIPNPISGIQGLTSENKSLLGTGTGTTSGSITPNLHSSLHSPGISNGAFSPVTSIPASSYLASPKSGVAFSPVPSSPSYPIHTTPLPSLPRGGYFGPLLPTRPQNILGHTFTPASLAAMNGSAAAAAATLFSSSSVGGSVADQTLSQAAVSVTSSPIFPQLLPKSLPSLLIGTTPLSPKLRTGTPNSDLIGSPGLTPHGKTTMSQGVSASFPSPLHPAFSPSAPLHTPPTPEEPTEANIMVPSNDKEGWCRNKKYIEKVPNGFKCSVCNKVYGRYNSVSYHVTIYHRNPPIKCDEPGCQFTTREARYIHFHKFYRHGTQLPKSIDLGSRSCPFCRHVSKSPAMLEKHINRHMPDCVRVGKMYKCQECGMELSSQKTMVEHIMTHNDEKTHQCDQCSYKGRTESNLQQHKLFKHSSALFKRKFVCDKCDYYCPTEGNLDAHKRRMHRMDVPLKRTRLSSVNDDADDVIKAGIYDEYDEEELIDPLDYATNDESSRSLPHEGVLRLADNNAPYRRILNPVDKSQQSYQSSSTAFVDSRIADIAEITEKEEEEGSEISRLSEEGSPSAPPPSYATSSTGGNKSVELEDNEGNTSSKNADSGAETSGTDLDDSHSNLASSTYQSIINYGTV